MSRTKTSKEECTSYRTDLDTLAKTGQASDEYINHLEKCDNCLQEMQGRVLTNIRALKE